MCDSGLPQAKRRPLGIKIIPLCDFRCGVLNARSYALAFNTCSQGTKRDYFIY
ncbi:hypothetical protein EUBHAL_02158 [Anaerobutyricum hallii DSM 3353]|uniref:Uncharacterized protein n=1 Tax=Anaerobutyricum hallii DSM 3353 TaxID=411469 RepID=C0EXL6_9FIRM|nr:hypothetical protein EUBHAL_02158 [Anaerobutyricum hallii DSM 3353]